MRLAVVSLLATLALAPTTAAAWTHEGGTVRRANASPGVNVQPPYETIWSRRVVARHGGLLEHGVTVGGGRVYGSTINGTTFAVNARTGQLLWKRDLGRRFATAPAFHRGRVYVNGREKGRQRARLWKVDARTGRILWGRKLGNGSEGSPLIVRRKVFVTAGLSGKLIAFGLNGRKRWGRRTCRSQQAPTWTGRLIVTADYCGKVRAYTPRGRLRWQTRVIGSVYAASNVVGRRLYVHTKAGLLYALNARTGRKAWVRRTGWGIGYPECAATKRRVWCANGWGDNRLSQWTARGRLRWTRRLPGQVMSAVVLTKRMLWVGTHDARDSSYDRNARKILGFNPSTGRKRVELGRARYDVIAVGPGRVLYLIHYARIEAIRER